MRSTLKFAIVFGVGIAVGAAGGFVGPNLIKHASNSNQPYADQHGRMISSLSADDVEQLKAGKGWGLAKPAEFNGYPGPAHVMEFEDQLALDAQQKSAVQESFARMQAAAKRHGEALVNAERALDAAFISKTVTPTELNRLLGEAERIRAELRAVHLTAHLEVTPILTDEQKTNYASLRGYGVGHQGHEGH